MLNPRIVFASVGLLAATLLLSACSATASSPGGTAASPSSASSAAASTATGFNDKDVAFASLMIPHHEQAVEMAQLVLDKSGIDSRVTDLAATVKSAQGPEITQMKSWLSAWGVPYVAMPGMNMGGEGMMSAADMSALKSATGVAASKLFLTQMIAHHSGAIVMAATEVSGGKNSDARALAKVIVDSQTAEVAAMKTILAGL